MRLMVSDAAADLIEERGGRLYVWVKKGRGCGAVRTLKTAPEAPNGQSEFRSIVCSARVEIFVPERLALPEELHIELRRFPRRVEAYWNGCAWVV